MARYFLKPIMWNTANYEHPSGVKVAPDSYPGEHGFGHEEWNHSDSLLLNKDPEPMRVFHTEPIGSLAPASDGQIFVFMYASHDGVQQLVGIAGNATPLTRDADRKRRKEIADELGVFELSEDAWRVATTRDAYDGDKRSFLAEWRKSYFAIPSWICPDSYYFWPSKPINLDARRLTSKETLPRRFGAYKEIDAVLARRVLLSVPMAVRESKWQRLLEAIDRPDDHETAEDISDVEQSVPNPTTRRALVQARLGQGQFRDQLIRRWDGACAVTGASLPAILRASHVKPWRSSSNRERLDGANGLLLSANIDALFDRFLISFTDDGAMLISDEVPQAERQLLGIPKRLRSALSDREVSYMVIHRQEFQKRAEG